jgi:L-asparaginase/Glu-tRNA(Gln) amidotransferase subunit D
VLNEEVNAARDVTKTNTYRVETFQAPELGMMGYVDADAVTFYRTSTKRHTTRSEFDVRGLTTLPQVDILYSYVEPNPALAKALADSGAKGIVFAGTGAGSSPRPNGPSPLLDRGGRGPCSCGRTAPATAASSRSPNTTRSA